MTGTSIHSQPATVWLRQRQPGSRQPAERTARTHTVEELLAGSPRLATSTLVLAARYSDQTTRTLADLLAALSTFGWTPDDIRALDRSWLTVAVVDLAGPLLWTSTELAGNEWTPTQVRDWLPVFYTTSPDGNLALTAVGTDAVGRIGPLVDTSRCASKRETMLVTQSESFAAYASAFLTACGDHDLAILAARAGLEVEEVTGGDVDLGSLRILAALRAGRIQP